MSVAVKVTSTSTTRITNPSRWLEFVSAVTHRFGASSASLEKIYGVVRGTNYLDAGVKAYYLTDVSTSSVRDNLVANAFCFRTYENSNNFCYNWTVNTVQHLQYLAGFLEVMADLHYFNKLGPNAQGPLCSDRTLFEEGMGIVTLQLDCPTKASIAFRAGSNSKCINTQFTLKQSSVTTPVVNADADVAAGHASFSCVNPCNDSVLVLVKNSTSSINNLSQT